MGDGKACHTPFGVRSSHSCGSEWPQWQDLGGKHHCFVASAPGHLHRSQWRGVGVGGTRRRVQHTHHYLLDRFSSLGSLDAPPFDYFCTVHFQDDPSSPHRVGHITVHARILPLTPSLSTEELKL